VPSLTLSHSTTAATRRSSGAPGGPAGPGSPARAADGPGSSAHRYRTDALRPFQTLIVIVRWVCLGISALLIVISPAERTSRQATVFALLAAWTAFRTVRPIRNWGFQLGTAISVVTELAISITAVCLTGYWDSPLAFLILPGVLVGGFSQGGPLVVGYGTVTSLIVTLTSSLDGSATMADWRSTGQWSIELMLVALVAGIGHRVVTDTVESHSATLHSVEKLSTANSLLVQLHHVAQSLPESLDLDDVLSSACQNVHSILRADSVAILLAHESPDSWLVAQARGVRLDAAVPRDLTPAITVASRSAVPIALSDFANSATLHPDARSGIYAPLRARGTLIGVLCVEHPDDLLDTPEQREIVRRLAEPTALAIDNARWFSRIGIVAADEERVRIARDLHDRVGQSLAYIGFELDRIGRAAQGTELGPEVAKLRADVRNVVSEVRETLYDLRTEVGSERGFVDTVDEFIERVRARTTVEITFEHDEQGKLPLRQERELWQIAKEAIVNVERHAQASALKIRWWTDGIAAFLEVTDNGRGIAATTARRDSYGLRGIYERANAIGAHLEIRGDSGQGTVVRCRLETP
jgi:signal transduction histidine kinase